MKETGNTKNIGVKDNLQDWKLVKIQSSGAACSVRDVEKKSI